RRRCEPARRRVDPGPRARPQEVDRGARDRGDDWLRPRPAPPARDARASQHDVRARSCRGRARSTHAGVARRFFGRLRIVGWRMRLQLTLLTIAVAAPLSGRADTGFVSKVQLYADSDHTTVISPLVQGTADVSPDTTVTLGYVADVVSSASVDIVSQ